MTQPTLSPQDVIEAAKLDASHTLESFSSASDNDVWFYGPYVLRISQQRRAALAQEAELLRALPPSVPHAPVVASGDGWMVLRRVEGEPLSAAWGAMDAAKRRAAAQQLAAILINLHQMRVSNTPSLSPGWFPALLPAEILRLATALRDRDAAHVALMEAVMRYTRHTIVKTPAPLRWGLIHRDISLDHVLWNGARITALLDFEQAVFAPRELELEAITRAAAASPEYAQLSQWLQEDYPLLFSEAGIETRLRLYHIEHDLRHFDADPAAPERLRAAVESA